MFQKPQPASPSVPTPLFRTAVFRSCKKNEKTNIFVSSNSSPVGYLCIFDFQSQKPLVSTLEDDKVYLLGRSNNCDFIIKNKFVSRNHLSLQIFKGKCFVRMESSSQNPSFLTTKENKQEMKYSQRYELLSGDKINIVGIDIFYYKNLRDLVSATSSHLKTGIYLDDRCCLHRTCLEKEHPESPERIRSIQKMIQEEEQFHEHLLFFKNRKATDEEILLAHSAEYLSKVKTGLNKDPSKESAFNERNGNIYFNEHTMMSSRLSAGGVIDIVERVIKGELLNGFAIVRPPGHHSGRDETTGFCFFNNAAIAARLASRKYGKKVVVIDWDVHHGNGTENILKGDDRILYFSTHRYGNGYFPETGNETMIGEKQGIGFNVNVPFRYRYNNSDMLSSFLQVLLPICLEFHPDLVIVSAGFDAVEGDPLGGCRVTPEFYGTLTKLLQSVTKNVVLALEGGYNVEKIAECSKECLNVLVGNDTPPITSFLPKHKKTDMLMNNIRDQLKPYWLFLGGNDEINEFKQLRKEDEEEKELMKQKMIEMQKEIIRLRKEKKEREQQQQQGGRRIRKKKKKKRVVKPFIQTLDSVFDSQETIITPISTIASRVRKRRGENGDNKTIVGKKRKRYAAVIDNLMGEEEDEEEEDDDEDEKEEEEKVEYEPQRKKRKVIRRKKNLGNVSTFDSQRSIFEIYSQSQQQE